MDDGTEVARVGTRRGGSDALGRWAFTALVLYYWGLQFAMRTDDEVQRGDLLYYLSVIPVALFSLLVLAALGVGLRLNQSARLMSAYVLVVCAVAAMRGDTQTILNTLLFGAAIVAILACRVAPSVGMLNRLLLASIAINAVLFLLGRSIYAVIPGFSTGGELAWRVSVFPFVATSAFFSLVVLFLNVLEPGAPLRRTCLLLSAYFLVFSGVRSALIAGVLGAGYLLLVRMGRLRRTSAKMTYLTLALAAFIASLFWGQLLLLAPLFGDGFVGEYLLRSTNGLESADDVAKAIYRTYLWAEHLRIASQNPLFGIGTFDFDAVTMIDPNFSAPSRGSEAFLTGLFARVGLPALLFVVALCTAIARGVRRGGHAHFVVGLTLFIAMLAYGSFINAYDFVFLVMIGLLAKEVDQGTRPARPALSPVAAA